MVSTTFPSLLLLLIYSLVLSQASVPEACKDAENKDFCIKSLKALDLEEQKSVIEALDLAQASVEELLVSTHKLKNKGGSSPHRHRAAIRDCVELLQDASELIRDSYSAIQNKVHEESTVLEDVHTWMSAALTYYTTCVDGFNSSDEAKRILSHATKAEERLTISLASIASLRQKQQQISQATTPLWAAKTIGNNTLLPNVTVAADGSGQFTTIAAALAAAPSKSQTRFIIYIKRGTYNESLEVAKFQNLMFMGDGIGKTIITGNKSVQDPNITTFTSATVVIKSDNFIAQDITFQNTAGAINHQAVAVRISADKVAFFRCSFEGYQDTLYAHSLRQFFTQCDIYGTVDYIFGNAAASFQNCNLYARLPLKKQKNTHTAQGRTDPNQNTGFAFQNCNVDGDEELKKNITEFPTYLGRPWKEYAVTVFLKCFQSSVLHPAGWLEWSGDFALSTLFYGEYFCYGTGANATKRVDWSTQIYNSTFANRYTAANLVNGNDWLPNTNLPFTLAL